MPTTAFLPLAQGWLPAAILLGVHAMQTGSLVNGLQESPQEDSQSEELCVIE